MNWAIMLGKWAVVIAAASLAGTGYDKIVAARFLPPSP